MHTVTFLGEAAAREAIGRMRLRPDMAAQWSRDPRVPNGPKWLLTNPDGEPVAIGGLEPAGAARSLAWLLVGDVRRRDWLLIRRCLAMGIDWARRHAIRRIHAAVASDRADHAAFAASLGLKLTGQDGDDAVMTLDLGE